MRTEAFKKIRNHFNALNYSDRNGFEYETEGLLTMCDSFYFDSLFVPFKDEVNANLLSLTKEKQIDYLKILLNDSPMYLRNETFKEEKKYVIEYIKDPQNKNNTGILKEYVVLTYQLWEEVLNTINDCCKTNKIECINDYDSDGIKNINFIETNQSKETTPLQEIEAENNFFLESIEDYLFEFKEEKIISEIDYKKIFSALKQYFETGAFPTLNEQIKVGKVNIKRFGWALNEIFRANKTNNENLPIEYLRFAKQNISIFKDVDFSESNFMKSNLYKYFTTKIK